MSNKKKIIIICTMVVMLVAAAYLNVLLAQNSKKNNNANANAADTTSTVTVFSAMRTDRDSTRAQTYGYLDSIIASESSSTEAKTQAEAEKMALIGYSDNELVLENLIKARGFEDACVTLSTENIHVLVKDADLDSTDVAQILGIVTEEMSCSATDVIVLPYATLN